MIKMIASVSFACLFATAVQAQTAGYVVTLGRDTVQVEQFNRSSKRIQGTVVYRAPTTRVVRYDLQLDSDGRPLRYQQTIVSADGKKIEPNAANATMTFVGDTIIREGWRASEAVTQAIAAPHGAMPMLGASLAIPFAYSYLTYELAFAQARKSVQNGETRLYLLGTSAGQTSPQALRVWLIGADSAEADYFGVARSGFKFDRDGKLLRSNWTATTYKYIVSRVGAVDVDAIARSWSAQDAAGAAFGRYSPRDTATFTLAGANLWLDYSRPSRRGRVIWGGVVPWNQVWRLGADMATQFRTDVDLVIGGTAVPAGTYTIWLLPAPQNSLLIINRQIGQFGTQYDPRQDFARIPLTHSATSENVERLSLSFREGRFWIEWGDGSYSVVVQRQ
jgi:hypothetical protein